MEQERDVYKAALPLLSEEAGELGPMLEAAANIMLDKPGTVRIQCRPEQPLALSQAFLTLLLQPQVLNLTVSAEPGDKSLSDWVPAALKTVKSARCRSVDAAPFRGRGVLHMALAS